MPFGMKWKLLDTMVLVYLKEQWPLSMTDQ